MSLRIGSPPFLNSRPLIEGLPNVKFHTPAELASLLRDGSLDAALVPIAEPLFQDGYHLVDGVSISSPRMVKSVIIAYARPLYEVRSISEDAQSLTSNLLGRLIMERDYGRDIRWVPDGDISDAQLLIGDRALEFRKKNPSVHVLDLARAWHDRRKVPFVFAVWAISPDATDPAGIAATLRAAKKQGLKKIQSYATNEDDLKYLTENLSYNLGKPEKDGILRFQKDLMEISLLDKFRELDWV